MTIQARKFRLYVVKKFIEGKWAFLTPKKTWNTNPLLAKTWSESLYADRESLKHEGAIVALFAEEN